MKYKYYHKVESGAWFLDYHKLSADIANLWIIMSGREHQGKTTNALQFAREKYLRDNEKSVWIFNCVNDIPPRDKFLAANMEFYPNDWENVELNENGLIDTNTKQIFLYFAFISSSRKLKMGGRDQRVRYIFYDEFNEGLDRIGHRQVLAFHSIVSSSFSSKGKPKASIDKLKIFLMSNNITSDVPLLTKWKINRLPKEEIEEYQIKDNFLIKLFNPKTSFQKKKQTLLRENWLYSMSDSLGMYDLRIVGRSLLDNNQGVVPPAQQDFYKVHTKNHYIKVSGDYFLKLWWNEERHHFVELCESIPNENNIFCVAKKDWEHGVIMSYELRDRVEKRIKNQTFWFDSYVAKVLLLRSFGVIKSY